MQNCGQTAGRRRRKKLLFGVATAVQLSEALFVWNWIEFCIVLSRLNFVVRFYRDELTKAPWDQNSASSTHLNRENGEATLLCTMFCSPSRSGWKQLPGE